MELVKLGKRGQVSIPTAILRELGLEGEGWLIAEGRDDGAIVLRPAAVYPVEIYSEERLREFEEEDRMSEEERKRVEDVLTRR